ncbi:sec1 family domain-containing protein 2 [Tachysurus ichikawai]
MMVHRVQRRSCQSLGTRCSSERRSHTFNYVILSLGQFAFHQRKNFSECLFWVEEVFWVQQGRFSLQRNSCDLGTLTRYTSVHVAQQKRKDINALGESDLADVLKQFLSLMRSGRGTEAGSESGPTDFCVDELLLLLVYVYSLAQETQASGTQKEEKVEREIIGALTLLLTQQTTLSPLLLGITDWTPTLDQIGPQRWTRLDPNIGPDLDPNIGPDLDPNAGPDWTLTSLIEQIK